MSLLSLFSILFSILSTDVPTIAHQDLFGVPPLSVISDVVRPGRVELSGSLTTPYGEHYYKQWIDFIDENHLVLEKMYRILIIIIIGVFIGLLILKRQLSTKNDYLLTEIIERQRIEKALRESETRLAEAQQLARLGYWEWNLISGAELCSPELWRILGLSPESTVFTHELFERAIHPDDREVVLDTFAQAITQHEPYNVMFRIVQPVGSICHIHALGRLVRDLADKPQRFIGTVQDITEHKQAEETLRKNEERIRHFFDLPLMGMATISPHTKKFLDINNKLCDMTNYSRTELLTLTWSEITHSDDLWNDAEQFEQLLSGEINDYSVDKRFIRKDGQIIYVSIFVNCIRHCEGQIDYLVVLIQDITKRKRAEENLRKSEEKLSSIALNAPVYIYEIDREGKILFVNRVYEGLTPNEVIGTTLTVWYPAEQQRVIQEALDNVFRTAQLQSIEYTILNPKGELRFYTAQIAPIKIGNDFNSAVLIANDFTERKKAEEALRQSEARLAEAQRIAHLGNWDWNIKTNELLWSDEVYRIFGLEIRSMTTAYHAFLNFIHPNDRQLVQSAVDAALYEKKPYNIDHRIVLPDGSIRFVHEQAEVTFNDQGEPVRMLGVVQDITERKQTEQMLKMIRYTIDNVNDSIFWINEKGQFINCNKTACNRLGYTREELLCLSVADVDLYFPPSRWPSHWEEVQQAKVLQIESLHETKRGEVFPVEITVHSMQFGDTHYICAWAHDITERKHAEKVLQESRDFINKINQVTPNVIYVYDIIEKKNFYVNEQVKTFLGYTPKEIRNLCERMWVDLIHPDDLSIIEKNLKAFESAKDGQVIESEYRAKHANGEWRWLWSREVIFSRTFQGKPSQILGTIQDITKRKLAEEHLRESEQYRRTLIEESLIGLALLDKAGKFIEVNSAFAKIIGYTLDEITNKLDCSLLTPLEYREEDLNQSRQLKNTGRFGPYEKEYLHKDGHRVPVRVSGLLINHKGQRFAWTNVEDITEQKCTEDILRQAKEAAEIANRAKSTFLANMSHELRTPLNGILGYTQLFKLDKTFTFEQQEGIDIIHRSGEHLLNLINDILDLSKVEAGCIELQPDDFNLKNFIEGIIYLFKVRAQQQDILFSYDLLSPLPITVRTDETKLRQILVNLLGNAIKFTRHSVCLKVGYHYGKIRFQIEDDGKGIASNDLEKIFLPFQQLGNRDQKIQGTGLGLSITKRLVEMMGGELRVTSVVNKGSVFWAELDLPEVPTSLREEAEYPIVGFEGPPCKILVIDDIRENRLVITNYLRPLGFEIIEAASSREGIEKAATQHPDLILMDLVMPEPDGFEATRQIRKITALKDVLIIAVSASVFDFHQQQSTAAGCNDFIAKPIRYKLLLEKLKTHLNLTWVYETQADGDILKEDNFSIKLAGPSAEQATVLLDLAMQGDILGITNYMGNLTKQDDKLILFASEICHLARKFKTARICEIARCYIQKK